MDNYAMIQYFEWYLPPDGAHWRRLAADAGHLSGLGISGVWIPPCCKATSKFDVGYGVYDLYDLGEFEQKGDVATKYGTRRELLDAVSALHTAGLKIYADVVMNHKAGADATEEITVVEVDRNDRDRDVSAPFRIEAWTRFDFPGRAGKYSEFRWNWTHFTATDYDQKTGRSAIYRIVGENKSFSQNVDQELGNYDYLMFADIDYHHPDVVAETIRWGKWLVDTLRLDGMRLDAVKHINEDFLEAFVIAMREHTSSAFFTVAEYWKDDTHLLEKFLADEAYCLTLFDVPLHYNLFDAGRLGRDYDLRTIFDGTLVRSKPQNVVTFVDNHDSQRHQALESFVADWFKLPAYALVLLRRDGYPSVFYGDYYGIGGDDPHAGRQAELDVLLSVRKQYAYGEEIDFFTDPHRIGWIRKGDAEHTNSGIAVVVNNAEASSLPMRFGPEWANVTMRRVFGGDSSLVSLDADGAGVFPVEGGSVSVYTRS